MAGRLPTRCGEPEVVNNQDGGLAQALHEAGIASLGTGLHELLKERGQPQVLDAKTAAAGVVPERLREVAVPAPLGPLMMIDWWEAIQRFCVKSRMWVLAIPREAV